MLALKYSTLFTYLNYRFSTMDHGRLSSLYYQDAEGNQGRWRRQHRNGEALFFQGPSIRVFVSPMQKNDFKEYAAMPQYRDLVRLGEFPGYSLTPKSGWHVVELCPPKFYIRHCSGGAIELNDVTAGSTAYSKLANYDDSKVVDWTIAA